MSSGGSDQVSSNSEWISFAYLSPCQLYHQALDGQPRGNRIGEMFANLHFGFEIVHEVIQSLDLRSWSEHFSVRGAWL